MRDEIRDIYYLMLGMEDITEFQGPYETWPRGDDKEYWYKGNIIDYGKVLKFLDEVYAERAKREKSSPDGV